MKHAPMIFVIVIMTITIFCIDKENTTQRESLSDSFKNTATLAGDLSKAYTLLDSSRTKLSQSLDVVFVIAHLSNESLRNLEINKYKKLFVESDSLRKTSITIIQHSYAVYKKSVAKHKEKFGY